MSDNGDGDLLATLLRLPPDRLAAVSGLLLSVQQTAADRAAAEARHAKALEALAAAQRLVADAAADLEEVARFEREVKAALAAATGGGALTEPVPAKIRLGGKAGLSTKMSSVLSVFADGKPRKTAAVAEVTGLSSSTVSQTLIALRGKGFVKADGAGVHVITVGGLAALAGVQP